LTNIHIERRSRRNGRKQEEHLRRARLLRDMDRSEGEWVNKQGAPTQEEKVQQWKRENPESYNKSKCAKELNLSRTTVTKWWNKRERD